MNRHVLVFELGEDIGLAEARNARLYDTGLGPLGPHLARRHERRLHRMTTNHDLGDLVVGHQLLELGVRHLASARAHPLAPADLQRKGDQNGEQGERQPPRWLLHVVGFGAWIVHSSSIGFPSIRFQRLGTIVPPRPGRPETTNVADGATDMRQSWYDTLSDMRSFRGRFRAEARRAPAVANATRRQG